MSSDDLRAEVLFRRVLKKGQCTSPFLFRQRYEFILFLIKENTTLHFGGLTDNP